MRAVLFVILLFLSSSALAGDQEKLLGTQRADCGGRGNGI
jgi:hypothetical protein